MNQKQFAEHGKSQKIPANVLSWIWKNIDKIEGIIQLLKFVRDTIKGKPQNRSSCQTPRPAPKLEPGYWECVGNDWEWVPSV